MKLNLKYAEGEWFNFKDDAKVKIRMFPTSKWYLLNVDNFTGEDLELIFIECVLDWDGFVDMEDNKIECTKENKKLMLDSFTPLVNFVIEKQNEIREKFEESIKN